MILQRQPDHLEPIARRGNAVFGFVGRVREGNEPHLLQAERLTHLLCRAQVPVVNGIKCSPQNSGSQFTPTVDRASSLDERQVVPVNDLIVVLAPKDCLNLTGLPPGDLPDLTGAVVHQALPQDFPLADELPEHSPVEVQQVVRLLLEYLVAHLPESVRHRVTRRLPLA